MKVAVYSGEIPSTTFIERLINGLSAIEGVQIYVFGRLRAKKNSYQRPVTKKGFKTTADLVLLGLYYRLLFAGKPGLWKKFCKVSNSEFRGLKDKWKYWGKVLPVVYAELDVFHLQWAKDLPNWIFLEELRVAVICSFRGAHINYSPLADDDLAESYRKLFPQCSGFHAVSKAIMKEASQYGNIEEKTKVIYSGLDLQEFPLNIKPRSGGQLKIISVGRAHWKKGYHYALDALKQLKDRNVDFSYTIVGGETEELQYQVNDLNLTSSVHFKKRLSIKEVKQEIGNHDLLLLPSIEEGIANVVLESMALGTLVVSTDCGGMAEIVRDGENGFLVPAMNAGAIASKLDEISTLSGEQIAQICTAARETIEEHHQKHYMVKGMVDLYRNATS